MSLVSVLHPLLFVFLLFQVSAYENTKDRLELQIVLYQLNFLDAMVRGWVDIFLVSPQSVPCRVLEVHTRNRKQVSQHFYCLFFFFTQK